MQSVKDSVKDLAKATATAGAVHASSPKEIHDLAKFQPKASSIWTRIPRVFC